MICRKSVSGLSLGLVLGLSSPVLAQEAVADQTAPQLSTEIQLAMVNDDRIGTQRRPEPEGKTGGPFDFEVTITGLSDYRYRGVSLSNGKPALQGELSVEHVSGFYGSVWASNVADNGGHSVELDGTLGYSHNFGGLSAQAGVTGYFYPGTSGLNYYELQGGLTTHAGKAELNASVGYAPHQSALAGQQNIYGTAGFELPFKDTPLTFNGSIGVEDGAFADKKIDWLLGASYTVKGFDVGLSYVDTAHSAGIPKAGATAVFSLSRKF